LHKIVTFLGSKLGLWLQKLRLQLCSKPKILGVLEKILGVLKKILEVLGKMSGFLTKTLRFLKQSLGFYFYD